MPSQNVEANIAPAHAQRIAEVLRFADGCGGSDILFFRRLHDGFNEILDSAPERLHKALLESMQLHGYSMETEAYEPKEGECSVTGLDEFYF